MDRNLRIAVAGRDAAWLPPHELSEFVEEDEFTRFDADLQKRSERVEVRQMPRAMGQEIDADAERPQCARRLEHMHIDADPVQR